MNDSELEKKLRAARVPERDEEYWTAFPRTVSNRLQSGPQESQSRTAQAHWLPRLMWGGGLALACLIIGFAIGNRHGQVAKAKPYILLQDDKMLREVLTLFPNRLRAIVQDERGVRLVLSDQADVPASRPIYVHICTGGHCSSLVTFSGQELDIAGQRVTILTNAKEDVIVAGNRFAWSSERPGDAVGGLKIEARELSGINL